MERSLALSVLYQMLLNSIETLHGTHYVKKLFNIHRNVVRHFAAFIYFFPADYRLPCTNKLNIDFSYFSSLIFYLIKNVLLTFSTLTPASGKLNILRFLITTYPTRLWEACIIKELYRELFLGTGLVEQQMCLPSLRQHENKIYKHDVETFMVKVLTDTWNQTVNI